MGSLPGCYLSQGSQQREVDGLPVAQDAENPVQVHLVLTETAWKGRKGLGDGSWLPTTLHLPQHSLTTITRMRALTVSVPGLKEPWVPRDEHWGGSESHKSHWDTFMLLPK